MPACSWCPTPDTTCPSSNRWCSTRAFSPSWLASTSRAGTDARRGRMRRPAFSLLLGALFFVSGFIGLVYEVIWAKYLALLLGSTAYAQVGVLAVFMGGLAAGSIVWGSIVDRAARPLAIYGALEIGIGV